MAVLIVYDITDASTWKRAKEWMCYVRDEGKGYDRVLVIGNKKDLENKREIDFEEANNECIEFGYSYMETSAKDGTHIVILQKWLDSHTENKVEKDINKNRDDGIIDLESMRQDITQTNFDTVNDDACKC